MSSAKIRFSIEIEKLKELSPDVTFIEIITEYCELHDIDINTVPKLLTTSLLQKISKESKVFHLIEDLSDHHAMEDLL